MSSARVCTRCVMDTSASAITFYLDGRSWYSTVLF